jgi:hypothetical protein
MAIVAAFFVVVFGFCSTAWAHHPAHWKVEGANFARVSTRVTTMKNGAVSGQGKMKFKLLYASERLPEEAQKVLKSAHGGFTVDNRRGKGEAYFALPGAGILQISADLKTIRLLNTPAEMKNVNLHNTTVWYREGRPYLTFPANDAGKVFTTTLDGALVHTLDAPTGKDNFNQPAVNEYFGRNEKFAPTDVDYLDGLLYVTTGYSKLDFVLTARVMSINPFKAFWNALAFGGRGNGPGQFGTGHGVTVPPGKKRIDVADRPNSEIDRFTPEGVYLSTLKLPAGSFPCDVHYLDGYAVVGCLHGPDRAKGAPIYVLKDDAVISTIMPKEDLGLERFQHIHNAVFRKIGRKWYILAQAWNPGDFAVLEQVAE